MPTDCTQKPQFAEPNDPATVSPTFTLANLMVAPEQTARKKIDYLLSEAGWVLQDRDQMNRNAALGVAVREFPLPAGPCDYLLFIEGKAAGVIEAKKSGVTLSGVAEQSEKYMAKLPEHLGKWQETLRFDYESTGDETFFRDMWDPNGSDPLPHNLRHELRAIARRD